MRRPRSEQAAFLSTQWPGLPDFSPGTGGLFDVALSGNQLRIVLKVGYDFVPGDPSHVPVGVPPDELEWTPDQKDQFRKEFASSVSGTWSHAWMIQSTRPLWTTQIDVTVVVLQDDRDPHFVITVEKFPEDAGNRSSSVCDPGYHHGGGVCDPNDPGHPEGAAQLDSRDNDPTRVRNGAQPTIGVWFDGGDTALDAGDKSSLNVPATDLTAHADWSVELRGHSSADGDATDNLELARTRTDAVAAELRGRGVQQAQILVDNTGEDGERADDPSARRVDVQVLDVQNQVTSAHEAGHMFGLADEYLYGGEGAGTPFPPDYAKLIADNARVPAGGLPAKGPGDGIMTNGMQVENWNYAPFVAALKQITGSNDWIV